MSEAPENGVEYFDEPHEYRIDGAIKRSCTQVIRGCLPSPYRMVDPVLLEQTRQRGKRIHAETHYLDEDDLDWDSVPAEDIPFIESYVMFKKETGCIITANEKIVVNRELGYAGRLDKKVILFGRKAILDVKSGVCGKDVGLQTAGYALAENCVDWDRYGLKLRPGKMAKLIPYKNPRDFIAFKDCVKILNETDLDKTFRLVNELAAIVEMDPAAIWTQSINTISGRYFGDLAIA